MTSVCDILLNALFFLSFVDCAKSRVSCNYIYNEILSTTLCYGTLIQLNTPNSITLLKFPTRQIFLLTILNFFTSTEKTNKKLYLSFLNLYFLFFSFFNYLFVFRVSLFIVSETSICVLNFKAENRTKEFVRTSIH